MIKKHSSLQFSYTFALKASLILVFVLTFVTSGMPLQARQIVKSPVVAEVETPVSCEVTSQKTSVYSAEVVHVRSKRNFDAGTYGSVKIFYKNTGNMPWFSTMSGCESQPVFNLGTDLERDHYSEFFVASDSDDRGWVTPQRIHLLEKRVNPGDIGTFVFEVKVPEMADMYREFFTPVVENVTWVESGAVFVDFNVGNVSLSDEDAQKMSWLNHSGKLSTFEVSGERSILVDLSEQKVYLRVGDVAVREFRVSTGAWKTPTPVGNFKIMFKQQVRIGGKAPFYIMPKFQQFRVGGYGFHALPSLGNAKLRARIAANGFDVEPPVEWFQNDALWTEAVGHIGIPVSHGCIRLLPEDAQTLFEFTEDGTPVTIQR